MKILQTDPMSWRLLLDKYLGGSKLRKEVMIHGSVLEPVNIHQSQTCFVDGFFESWHIFSKFS